jgi:hypothetical protein
LSGIEPVVSGADGEDEGGAAATTAAGTVAGRRSIRSSVSPIRASLAAGSACAFSARSNRSASLANCALALRAVLSIPALSVAISALRRATTSLVSAGVATATGAGAFG